VSGQEPSPPQRQQGLRAQPIASQHAALALCSLLLQVNKASSVNTGVVSFLIMQHEHDLCMRAWLMTEHDR